MIAEPEPKPEFIPETEDVKEEEKVSDEVPADDAEKEETESTEVQAVSDVVEDITEPISIGTMDVDFGLNEPSEGDKTEDEKEIDSEIEKLEEIRIEAPSDSIPVIGEDGSISYRKLMRKRKPITYDEMFGYSWNGYSYN